MGEGGVYGRGRCVWEREVCMGGEEETAINKISCTIHSMAHMLSVKLHILFPTEQGQAYSSSTSGTCAVDVDWIHSHRTL